jgi:hypothetical protein
MAWPLHHQLADDALASPKNRKSPNSGEESLINTITEAAQTQGKTNLFRIDPHKGVDHHSVPKFGVFSSEITLCATNGDDPGR